MWAMPTVRAAWGMAASILLLISHVDLISATAGGVYGVSSPVSLQLRGSSVPDSSLRLRGGGIPCLTGIFGGGNKASGGSAPKIIIAGAPASGKGAVVSALERRLNAGEEKAAGGEVEAARC